MSGIDQNRVRDWHENIRFSRDRIWKDKLAGTKAPESYIESVRKESLASSVRIDQQLFPTLHQVVENVRERIFPDVPVEAYIKNSSEFQAVCFPSNNSACLLSLSSALVSIHRPEELAFVIGHEIGHYAMSHHAYPKPEQAQTRIEKLNILSISRATEITADRFGLLSVQEPEHAHRAILKMVSGLDDTFIRFDVAAYLQQARELYNQGGSEYSLLSTHPICATRLRALLYFEMSEPYYRITGKRQKAPYSKEGMDKKIEKDLASSSGFRLQSVNRDAVNESLIWGVFMLFLADKKLSKEEQQLMTEVFGSEVAQNALNLLKKEGAASVQKRFRKSLAALCMLDDQAKEALFHDLQHFAELAGGSVSEKQAVLSEVTETMKYTC